MRSQGPHLEWPAVMCFFLLCLSLLRSKKPFRDSTVGREPPEAGGSTAPQDSPARTYSCALPGADTAHIHPSPVTTQHFPVQTSAAASTLLLGGEPEANTCFSNQTSIPQLSAFPVGDTSQHRSTQGGRWVPLKSAQHAELGPSLEVRTAPKSPGTVDPQQREAWQDLSL